MGEYQSLMRRLRPAKWIEVMGQPAVTKSLVNMLTKGQIPQTILLEGERGLGKTTCGRLLAARLNCRKVKDANPNPCGKCPSCSGILSGHENMLVHEVDCGTDGGVDSIREIIGRSAYGSGDRFRVNILDEFHLTSKTGQSALLKSTEEPNKNVIWILCTTEGHKVTGTIRSRCTSFKFRLLSESAMDAFIQHTVNGLIEREEVEWGSYDEQAIKSIVELSDGSIRQGLAILEQMVAYGGDALTAKDVLTVSGRATSDSMVKLVNYIVKGDIRQADMMMRDLYNDSFVNDLLTYFYKVFIPTKNLVDDRRMVARLIRAILGFDSAFSTSVNRSGLLFSMYDAVHGDNLPDVPKEEHPMGSKAELRAKRVKRFVKILKASGNNEVIKEWDGKRIIVTLGKPERTLVVVSGKGDYKATYKMAYNAMKDVVKSGKFDPAKLKEDGIIKKLK